MEACERLGVVVVEASVVVDVAKAVVALCDIGLKWKRFSWERV